MSDWIKDEAIVDLVVTTLLRVNSIATKECLGKSMYNLLCPIERRESVMIAANYSVLSALMNLSKVASRELLEVCMRSIYNISCQIPKTDKEKYVQAFLSLKVCCV